MFWEVQWAALSSSWPSWRPNLANTNVLLDRITSVGDLQSAWCLLLHCATARVNNFWLRSVPPELSGEFVRGVWRCMCHLLHINPATVDDSAKAVATLPLAAGGLGLCSAERLRHEAHWASWADMLKALSSRVPSVAANFIAALEAGEATPSIQSVLGCIDNLAGVGFVVPAWEVVVASSLHDEEEEVDPAQPKHGWQSKATWVVDSAFRQHTIFPALADDQAALLRSQAGPMASAAFIAMPSMKDIDPQQFRLLFLRRLRLPLPASALLLVWPSPRRPWPPPCSVRKCRSFGSSWLGLGECCHPCLPRSGRACQNESGDA